MVGYEPAERIDVVVDDPFAASNGSAFPGAATVFLMPTPPTPGSMIARNRDWGEILAVHELAHVAHLARPSRNPRDRWLRRMAPVPVRAIAVRTPRWATEGYATLIEGRLTGSGRPHGAWRPAVLRQWALEGALPTYGRLNGSDAFLGRAIPYLVGSAFLEWLVAGSGEESPPKVWRRITARTRRDFGEAFAGVFGGPPEELYGRFTVEVTERALEIEERLAVAGLAEGERFQRLSGDSEGPAVSPDGRHLAIVRRPDPDRPAEVVVWTTAPDTLTADERAFARDPEDVPPVEWRPRPKEAVARLGPAGGLSYRAPRWLPDGEGILVVRQVGSGDGRARPELFEWRWRDGDVRRVTRGAAIRNADPGPDGESAVGSRCENGRCDLVRIDLSSGEVQTLAAGEPGGIAYDRPRLSPDGRRIVASVREGERWRVGLFDADGRFRRHLGPDDGATRFHAAFLDDGEAVVAASDRGGIWNLERIDLTSGSVSPLTRTPGAAIAPVPDPTGRTIFFLLLRSRGWDLHRIDPDSVDPGAVVEVDPGLAPAAMVPPEAVPAFEPTSLEKSRPYGLGPRHRNVLPAGYGAAEGWAAGVALHGVDPVGRFSWLARAMLGGDAGWRGASLAATWRGLRPWLGGQAFWARHRPSEQGGIAVAPTGSDLELLGGLVTAELHRDFLTHEERVRAGASLGRLDGPGFDGDARALAFVDLSGTRIRTGGGWRWRQSQGVHGAVGETAGETWARVRLDLRAEVGPIGGPWLALESSWGRSSSAPGEFERFVVGGVAPPLFDPAILSQRIPEPAVPVGYAKGEPETYSVEIGSGALAARYRWLEGGEEPGRWRRVVAAEARYDQAALPLLRLPATRIAVGVGRALDPPFDDETRLWAVLALRP